MRQPVVNPQERYIEKKVAEYGKKLGWLTRKLQWLGHHGAPDRVFIRSGRILFIEFKQLGKKPTDHQALEMGRLRDAGMEVHLIDSVEKGKALLDRLTNYREGYDLV